MVRFMVVTFAFLAWGFYVMSGGANFDPDRTRLDGSMSDPLKPAEAQGTAAAEPRAVDIEVTRVSLNLASVEDVVNGDDGSGPSARLPQQSEPAVRSEADAETFVILPSLVEDASPQAAPLDGDVTDANVISATLDTTVDIRVVTGNRVNVRGGPGTSHGVVGTLIRGDRVEVLEESGTGWVRMRAADGGTTGWMADFLLTTD